MSGKIITISRQFGSGGRTIGRLVAERLRIPCYDKELIEKMADESGFASDYIEEKNESARSSSRLLNALSYGNMTAIINEERIWESQCKVLFDIAGQGSCVIIGRCGDRVLKDRYDLLTVFVHAPEEKRAERIVNIYGENEISIRKRINDKDKRRRAYYQLYTDCKWGDALNYDLCFNSAAIGIEKCADVITEMYL